MFSTGYYIETINIKNIEMILDEMREAAKKAAEIRFHKQLSTEIEILVDSITTGIINRPEGISIYDAALQLLNDKLNDASVRQADSGYNYNISANILVLENKTYFKVNSSNDFFLKAFNRIHSLQPFPLGDDWQEIFEKYNNRPLMWIQLLSWKDLTPNYNRLHFSSKIERADRLARHNLTNHILSQYACGKDIPPHKLMDFMDLSMNELIKNSFYKKEMENQKANALTFLLDIDKELLFGEEKETVNDKA